MSIEKERELFDQARKEVENIAEIKEMLLNNDELKWCDESKRYINGRVFQDAETSYINGALFGWIQSANREGYKLVPVDDLKHIRALNKDAGEADEKYLKEINNTLGRIVNEMIEGNNE